MADRRAWRARMVNVALLGGAIVPVGIAVYLGVGVAQAESGQRWYALAEFVGLTIVGWLPYALLSAVGDRLRLQGHRAREWLPCLAVLVGPLAGRRTAAGRPGEHD